MSKDQYKGIKLSGRVEKEYLFCTLFGSDILPFCHLSPRIVLLPIVPRSESFQILKREDVEYLGHSKFANWLTRVEQDWTTEFSTCLNIPVRDRI